MARFRKKSFLSQKITLFSRKLSKNAPFLKQKKIYDPNSKSTAELRCSLPHPTKSVIPIKRDAFGTDFVCLCCRTEFRLPKMAFYEAGVNSMLTGFCFIGQHTQDASEIGKSYFRFEPEVNVYFNVKRI